MLNQKPVWFSVNFFNAWQLEYKPEMLTLYYLNSIAYEARGSYLRQTSKKAGEIIAEVMLCQPNA